MLSFSSARFSGRRVSVFRADLGLRTAGYGRPQPFARVTAAAYHVNLCPANRRFFSSGSGKDSSTVDSAAASPSTAKESDPKASFIEESNKTLSRRKTVYFSSPKIGSHSDSANHSDSSNTPNMSQLIAIDQGTTSSRAILFSAELDVVKSKQQDFEQHYPQPGWCEHDPEEIVSSVKECLKGLGADKASVAGIGITNQRETTVAWSRKTGKPFCKAVVWLDTRTQSSVAQLLGGEGHSGNKDKFRDITGLPISTYFSGVKIKWLLDNVPEVKKAHDDGDCCFGTIDCWLVYNMTNGARYVTDISNASRYLLMDLKTKDWSDTCLKEFGVKREALPTIVSNCDDFGTVSGEFLPELEGVPITATIGDQHAALVGQCCYEVGESKNTYGTGCFLM